MTKIHYVVLFAALASCSIHDENQRSQEAAQENALTTSLPLRVAHLTDPHVYDGKSKHMVHEREHEGCLNLRFFERAVQELNAQHKKAPINLVAVTGDIGIENLIEDAGISCKNTVITTGLDGTTLFDGINKDTAIHENLVKDAALFANVITTSQIDDWLFVNGNNDLCNEDIKSVRYFTDYMAELAKPILTNNPAIKVHNLVGDGEHVSVFSKAGYDEHIFIGFENGSWKNNHAARYADSINKAFQYGVLNELEVEVANYERLGKNIHLIFHCPNFDDPWHAGC